MSGFKAGKQTPSTPGMKSTLSQGSNMGSKDSAGVGSGLSARSDMESTKQAFKIDEDKNPLTGNPTGRIEKLGSTSAKKFGKDFDIC